MAKYNFKSFDEVQSEVSTPTVSLTNNKYEFKTFDEVQSDRLNSWGDGAYNLLNEAYDYYGKWHSQDDQQGDSYDKLVQQQLRDAESLRQWYAGDEEALAYIDQYTSAFKEMQGYAADTRDIYSQWDNEEDYLAAVEEYERQQKYSGMDYEGIRRAMESTSDPDELEWLQAYAPSTMTESDYDKQIADWEKKLEYWQQNNRVDGYATAHDEQGNQHYIYEDEIANAEARLEELKSGRYFAQKGEFYAAYPEAPDFEEKSAFTGKRWDGLYNYINATDAERNTEAGRRAIGTGAQDDKYDYMTEDEVAIYNYLYNTEGKKAANEYLEYLEYSLDERRMKQQSEIYSGMADEHPILASALSVPANLASGAGLLNVTGQNAIKGAVEFFTGEYYKPINYNGRAMTSAFASTSIRGTVAENLADKYGTIQLDAEKNPFWAKVLNGKSFGDVYQLGMSMADSWAVATMYPVIGKAGSVLLGGAAGTQGMLDAISRGATDEQALMMGYFNGAFEMIFESMSIESLYRGDAKNVIHAMLRQSFAEGSEEFNTSLANNIADIIIMAENSNYEKNIAAYMEQGMSREEAKKQALWDMSLEMAWDFVGGMATGSIMGGGTQIKADVSSRFAENRQAKNVYGADSSALVNEALELDPDNGLAQKAKGKLDAGKSLSGRQLSTLARQNEQAVRRQIQTEAKARLTELGETGDVQAISEAIAKQELGESLTEKERAVIQKSDYAHRVLSERASSESPAAATATVETEKQGPVSGEEYRQALSKAGVVSEERTQAVQETQGTQEAAASESAYAEEVHEDSSAALEDAAKKYGAQAGLMMAAYKAGQDVEDYDAAYRKAYDMAYTGQPLEKVMERVGYLDEAQIKSAYETGEAAAKSLADRRDDKARRAANGKSGRKKGTVKGEGVHIADLKKSFNDAQGKAYKALSTIAEITGIDIVLYKSETNSEGDFEGENGRFRWSEDKIYIDINAGLSSVRDVSSLATYTMLKTFSHEFTHFLEKWNAGQYNVFRKLVFRELENQGEDVSKLIDEQIKKAGTDKDGKDILSYDAASREVVAEAMVDILQDANFVEMLAEKHKSIFDRLLEKLKEFVEDIKSYFDMISKDLTPREARALKAEVDGSIRYMESIAKLFDNVAVQAVENYQAAYAVEETEAKPAESISKPAEQVAEAAKPKVTTSKNGFTITDNSEYNSIEIKFNEKPSEAVRDVLKANKFRWNGKKGIWYGKTTHEAIAEELNKAYEAEKTAERERIAEEKRLEQERLAEEARKEAEKAEAERRERELQEAARKAEAERLERERLAEEERKATEKARLEAERIEQERRAAEAERQEQERLVEEARLAEEAARRIDFKNADQETLDKARGAMSRAANGLLKKAGISEIPWGEGPASYYLRGTLSTSLPTDYVKIAALAADRTELSPKLAEHILSNPELLNYYRTVYGTKRQFKNAKELQEHFRSITSDEQARENYLLPFALREKAEATAGRFTKNARISIDRYSLQNAVNIVMANELLDDKGELKMSLDEYLQSYIDGKPPLNRNAYESYFVYADKAPAGSIDLEPIAAELMEGKSLDEAFNNEARKAPRPDDVSLNAPAPRASSWSDVSLKNTRVNKEVNTDGEKTDIPAAVQQPDTDGQGAARLLDEVETGDVPGDAQGRDALGSAGERERQASRDGMRPDAERSVGGHGEGSSEGSDLRRDDGLSAEKLHEEVAEQIEQKSTEQPKGRNFVIGESLDLPKGEKARYKANVEAIRLVKKLEAEGRYATEAEQAILSKYVGWGGLANAFDAKKTEWAKEHAELKELLTDEEYALARGSTLNAHYTEISVIKAMYDGLAGLGFKGGRMLEPSSGVGNFVGAMPAGMSAGVKSWTMVELDSITGLIAKYLYPNADVRIQGFEKANIPDNYMDVAISNVPFGNYAIADKKYPKRVTSAIHNYFFAKTLDKVRPGGIVMFITSSYTMNSKDSAVRKYIMDRADLLGAIRLPDTAFKGNAGTEVVTDILVLKKRAEGTEYSGVDFLEAPFQYIDGYRGANINSYFTEHPEMVLGTASMEGSMYRGSSLTYKAFTDRGSLADQIREAFTHIKGKMDYTAQKSPERTNFAVERASKKTKENGLVSKNGKVYRNIGGELVEQTVSEKTAERIGGLLNIRDAARELQTALQQGQNEKTVKQARQRLNKIYDEFVKKHGYINAQANKAALKDDPDCYSVFALENWDSDTKTGTKSDIFSKNTIAPNRTVTSAKDVSEGLIVSRNQTGGVDVALIARLTGQTEESVTRELIESRQAFKNRDGELEAAEVYLSGNVRAKLRDAEALAPIDGDYKHNVEALKSVVPADVAYHEIYVTPGTPWIPASVYSDFAAYMLGSSNSEWRQRITVKRNAETGNFTVELFEKYLKGNAYNTQKWGTARRSFLELFDAMLNSKSVVVRDKVGDTYVINKDATAAANAKIEEIAKEFQDWLWRDEARRTELAELYNETFNAIVTPKYNGDNLTVNGSNAMKPLRPHQRDAVQRVISSGGNTLLAHKVGAGKTYEMAAAAMKLKELGLVQKPMFAVPKSLVAQWGTEFIDFFPAAKLLVAEATDFTAANRKTFISRIANGNYDAVIVSYEQFEKIAMSDEFTRELYEEEKAAVIRAIEEERASGNGKSLSVKDLEKKRKSLQTKIDKLTDKAKDEEVVSFEQLGVDSLFIDEAHNFKNLFYTTSMTNVSGLGNKDGAKRAFDLYTKVRYLQRLNGGRGIVFATATPVMNSMSEMYIMQKYLQPDLLAQLGLSTFDAWAKQFGEVVNGVEIKPSGQGYRVKQSFSRFKNMSELQLLFRNFADVLTDVPGLKIPKMKGGKVNVVVCEPGQFQQDFMKELEKRADNIKNVDPSVDNMLKITSDGRKISYTQRMIDPSLPYEEGCKIYRCADNVAKAYKESKAIKGTQLIFCDMATPKGKSKTGEAEESDMDIESAKLYDDIRARLIKKGIPAKEIAFIHEADTDQKKKKLFADVNEGKVRVLIGSTGKMGVGMNAQKRIVAIHHLDAPWRPGDVEQRNGRAFRQGNINEEVECFTYVTEGSFDARLWDILERKQNFINQVMNGENIGRETEDTGEVTLSAAEVKALASGSPLIMEQVQLDTDIKKLESLRRAHMSGVADAKQKLEKGKGAVSVFEKRIEAGKADIAARVDTYSEGKFSIKVGNRTYRDKKEAGTALMAAATAKAKEDGYTVIGSFAGFELKVVKTHEGIKGLVSGKQGYDFKTYPDNTTYMVNHLISVVEGIDERVKTWELALSETRKDIGVQEKLVTEPFAKQAELDQKRARCIEVMEQLNPKEEQSLDSIDDEQVQYQARKNLSTEAEEFRRDIDEWSANGKPDGETFILGSTGSVFQGLGAIESDIYMLSDKINTIFEDHPEMTVKEIKNIPEILENPVMILASKNAAKARENTRLVVLGMVKAQNGLPVLTVLDLRPIENKIYLSDMQKVASAYTKDGSPTATMNLIQNSTVLYADKEKTTSLLHSVGFQYAYSVEQSGYIGNITYVDKSVNVSGKKFTDVFTEDIEQHQRRVNLTDREVLTAAASRITVDDLTEGERDALKIFVKRLDKFEELQIQRAELGRLYKEQQFGTNVDRNAAKATLERMHELDEQVEKAEKAVLDVEEKEVLKRVLKKARAVVEEHERKHGEAELKEWRERRDNAAAVKKYRGRIRRDVDELSKWVLHPNNKDALKHVPDAVKNAVIPFITSIDFTSKRQLRGGEATQADKAFIKQVNEVKKALKGNVDVTGLYSGYNDLPPDFMETLQGFIDNTQELVESNSGEYIINQMSAEELRELSKIVRTLKKYIMDMNRFHANAMFQYAHEAGDSSVSSMKELKDAGKRIGAVSDFMLWQQMRPSYAFERFGKGGMAIYDGLRRGQATLAFNTIKIKEFAEGAYTENEVKAWEKEIKSVKLGDDTVKMPVSSIMSLYELSKRPQALTHILGEGIRVATYKNGKEKISDVGHILTIKDVEAIIDTLTPRQKEVADNLQKFMARQGGEWGNFVSMKRFGEELFGEEHYFPIHSDGRHLQSTADEHPSNASLYALLNMSFTKELKENANNRIVLYSIFDVFANHMASMAQYNAFALPILDALKWFNYQSATGSVREEMSRVFGVPEETRPGKGKQGYAESFVLNVIRAFNGTEAQGVPLDEVGLKSLRRYNMAQVAYNFRVVVQQPMAITRAALIIDYASIAKGMRLSPAAIRKNIEEMQKYSGIAAWKSLGFYDINISRGLTDIIKHKSDVLDKIGDIGMKGAETMDTLTWAGIWSACKEEVQRKQHISPKDAGFYEAVTVLFEDVIYKTQVVDSVLTKNEFLRSKGFWGRAVGSFMSEPTTTASMLIDAYDKYSMDMQRGMTRQQAWKKNRKMIGRTAYVYAVSAILLAAVQAVADAFRDDDDYQTWLEKWWEAFGGNVIDELIPFNKLPILSDFYDLAKELLSIVGVDTYGNPPQSVFMQWYDSLINGTQILYDKISGEDTNYTWYGGIYKLFQALSGMSGLPMAAATREVITAWNSIVGAIAPSLKVETYEPSEKNQIKYAYQDGWLTEEEALEQLLEQGIVETEDEAYWTMREWEAGGSSYSRFDDIYGIVRNGGDIKAEMAELTSHGYSRKEVESKISSQVGTWYRDGEISKQQATQMLTKYTDMEAEDITKTMNKWSAQRETGIAYNDIGDEYLAGNITASKAIDMYVKYGGMTKDDATWRVKILDWQDDGYDVDTSNKEIIIDYETYCVPARIDRDVYYDAYLFYRASGASGERYSKTEETMPYINSLPLTAEQKTALALCWWAESTVNRYKLW